MRHLTNGRDPATDPAHFHELKDWMDGQITREGITRYLTLPELRLRGPQRFAGKLPLPAGEFQDLVMPAFPVPADQGEVAKIPRAHRPS